VRNACKVSAGKILTRSWEDNIKIDLKEVECAGVD
jgi:hypothetical protein